MCDLGSYLNNYKNRNIELEVVVEASKDTLNVYSAIANNPEKTEVAGSNFDASMEFIEFLVSDEIQNIFEEFGKNEFGRPLFNPYVKLLKSESNPEMIEWIQELAYFDGTECPLQYRYQNNKLYQTIMALTSPIQINRPEIP